MPDSLIKFVPGSRVRFVYTNWKDNTAVRTGILESISFGTTPYHKEPQWFLNMFDLDKQARRTFAMKDIDGFTLETF